MTTNTQPPLGLTRQTSFGANLGNPSPFATQAANLVPPNQMGMSQQPIAPQSTGLFGGQGQPIGQTNTNVPVSPFGATIAFQGIQGQQVPGQLTQSPSFGNINQPQQLQSQVPQQNLNLTPPTTIQPNTMFPNLTTTQPTQPVT